MKNKTWIIALNLILFLGYFGYSILNKEYILDEGEKVLLKLAPVDPRSLMQGDYMTLNYAMGNDIRTREDEKGTYLVISKDNNDIGKLKRIQEGELPLSENEYLIKFKKGRWDNIRIGAESYFFQEGKAKSFENAEYGCLRIDEHGNTVLEGLYSEDLKLLE